MTLTVKALRQYLNLIDNEDAEVMIQIEDLSETPGPWRGKAQNLSFIANRRYIHPESKLIACRPCKETSGCKETLVLYVES